MGRPNRAALGGFLYHVLNRSNARQCLFEKDRDFVAFECVLSEAVRRCDMRLLSYCIMPNHWHLVVWPRKDGDLSRFVGWLTLTHTQRWHANHGSAGTGHLYQGRFKSFPLQGDDHFLNVCRYVERNPLRANLVTRAEEWRWGSLWRWCAGNAKEKELLSTWPVRRSPSWLEHVNRALHIGELSALRKSVQRGNPYGSDSWNQLTIKRLGLESTVRSRGRPRECY